MPTLVVRKVDPEIIRGLKSRAGVQCISMAEAVRRILHEVVRGPRRHDLVTIIKQLPPNRGRF